MPKLLHGSANNNITHLHPTHIFGTNGTTKGTGIYLTDIAERAMHYAGDSGSVYVIKVDTREFLAINDEQTLSQHQADTAQALLEELDRPTRLRLASDICGMKSRTFENDEDAEEFYRECKTLHGELKLSLDRLKPRVDYDDDGNMMILYAHDDFSGLSHIPTRIIHHRLCLFDTVLSSHIFNHICKGLEIHLEGGHKEFLSFANELPVHRQLDQAFLSKPNALSIIKKGITQSNGITQEASM